MNEKYETTSTIANIIQLAVDAVLKLDKESVEIPNDVQEITRDVQAAVSRHVTGGK